MPLKNCLHNLSYSSYFLKKKVYFLVNAVIDFFINIFFGQIILFTHIFISRRLNYNFLHFLSSFKEKKKLAIEIKLKIVHELKPIIQYLIYTIIPAPVFNAMVEWKTTRELSRVDSKNYTIKIMCHIIISMEKKQQ